MILLNQLIQGILLGGYYALIACGLSLMFSVMKIINLAHGSLAVLAAYMLWVLAQQLSINPFVGLVFVLLAMAAIGWFLQSAILERSARAGPLVPVLSTFGLAIVLESAIFEIFGADTRSLAPFVGSLSYDSWAIGNEIFVGKLATLIFCIAVLVLGGLHLFLLRTQIGRAIRATAEDPDTAELVGVNSRAVNAVAAAIALMTVGIAGLFLALRATFDPYAGPMQLLFAFEAAVIGGAGSLWGTLAGGIILGVAQSIGAQIHPQGFLIAGHSAFLIILFGRIYLSGFSLRTRFWALLGHSA